MGKKGKAAVLEISLLGIKDIIETEESKETITLNSIFPALITVYNLHSKNCWDQFWTNPPRFVGIDAKGNQISPPVLVQISTESYTILEVPLKGHLSNDLKRLLKTNITKVFCDNFSNRDKKCLGLNIDSEECGNKKDDKRADTDINAKSSDPSFTKPPIMDIETLA